jgi:hypothetical protein
MTFYESIMESHEAFVARISAQKDISLKKAAPAIVAPMVIFFSMIIWVVCH